MSFDRAFQRLMGAEGGYSNDPQDSGGETYRGIARNFHPDWRGWAEVDRQKIALGIPAHNPEPQACRALAAVLDGTPGMIELVQGFYKAGYWDGFDGDSIPYEVAYYLFQFAVNAGSATTAGKLLQGQLNYMNKNGALFPDLAEDGKPGPMTFAALDTVLSRNDGLPVLMALMRGEAIAHYKAVMKRKPEKEKYCFGWITRAMTVEA